VRGGFKFCGPGADKKFQPAQDSNTHMLYKPHITASRPAVRWDSIIREVCVTLKRDSKNGIPELARSEKIIW